MIFLLPIHLERRHGGGVSPSSAAAAARSSDGSGAWETESPGGLGRIEGAPGPAAHLGLLLPRTSVLLFAAWVWDLAVERQRRRRRGRYWGAGGETSFCFLCSVLGEAKGKLAERLRRGRNWDAGSRN